MYQQQRGLRQPYVKKPYYEVIPSSASSSSSESTPYDPTIQTISCYPIEGGFIHHYIRLSPTTVKVN